MLEIQIGPKSKPSRFYHSFVMHIQFLLMQLADNLL